MKPAYQNTIEADLAIEYNLEEEAQSEFAWKPYEQNSRRKKRD